MNARGRLCAIGDRILNLYKDDGRHRENLWDSFIKCSAQIRTWQEVDESQADALAQDSVEFALRTLDRLVDGYEREKHLAVSRQRTFDVEVMGAFYRVKCLVNDDPDEINPIEAHAIDDTQDVLPVLLASTNAADELFKELAEEIRGRD